MTVQSMAPRTDDGFATSADGERWIAPGTLTFDNVAGVLERARATPLPTRGIVDLADVHTLDSSAVALLLGLRRLAAAQRTEIAFHSVPPALASLTALYGVEDLVGR